MDRTMEMILSRVQKPARYTGGEYNAVVKDRRSVDTRVALCFPGWRAATPSRGLT